MLIFAGGEPTRSIDLAKSADWPTEEEIQARNHQTWIDRLQAAALKDHRRLMPENAAPRSLRVSIADHLTV